MISLDKIEESIIELEQADTCFQVCDRLASLYVVRDHLTRVNKANEKIQGIGESEFIKACNGKSVDLVLNQLDKLMNEIQVLYPKSYNSIIQKIKNL